MEIDRKAETLEMVGLEILEDGPLEVGKVYTVHHETDGDFRVKVVSISGNDFELEMVGRVGPQS